MKEGSSECISVAKWVVPQSWGTSNSTFVTDMVGDIEISFVEYLASKKVRLQLDHNRQTDYAGPRGSIGLPREDNKNR